VSIQFKRSSTPAAVPSTLATGELALNRGDHELYYKNASNEIVSLFAIDCGEILPSGISLWKADALDSNWHWST
jgi:hypothetical protein